MLRAAFALKLCTDTLSELCFSASFSEAIGCWLLATLDANWTLCIHCGFFLSSFSAVLALDFTGPVVSVLDGDTIESAQHPPERVRLSGIDCSEKGQASRQQCQAGYVSLVFGKQVCSRPLAKTSTSAPLPMCSCRMAPTSITRWITKRCSAQDERAVCLHLRQGTPPRSTLRALGTPRGGRADRVRLVWVYAHRCGHTTADAILNDLPRRHL